MLRTRTAAVVGTVALAAGVVAGAGGYAAVGDGNNASPVDSTASAVSTASSHLSVGAIYQKANAGVVEITATSNAAQGDSTFPFGEQQGGTQQAQGSGFVYDTAGHVITNYHVVQGATSLEVTLSDGSSYDATVVGTDPSTDLAVLKIDAPTSQLHPLALADSSDVAVGDGVVAIGSPYGLEETVTSGIVSALGRTIESTNGYSIPGTIQTDAAINHGNSGGPLLNLSGKVIGVTSQIESESGGNTGVGFAIPSNTVRSVVDQLIAGHEVEHAYLGVRLQETAGSDSGAQVASVSDGSPAAKAGLAAGDVITAFDGDTIDSADALTAAVSTKSPGDEVTVTYTRDGDSHTAQVTLGTRPS